MPFPDVRYRISICISKESCPPTHASLIRVSAQEPETIRDLVSDPCQYLHLSGIGAFVQALDRLRVVDKLESILDDSTQCADLFVTLNVLGGLLHHEIS